MEALTHVHFIRPWWFAALPGLLALVWLSWRKRGSASGWYRVIDPTLLAPLLEPAGGRAAKAPYWLAAIASLIAVIGLAGPSTERLPQPTYSSRTGLIIVLDLSPSMMAQDVDPDRITVAHRKIRDILARRGDGQTALVVYSGDAHVVTPLTDDVDTIALFLPSLQPSIMPAAGNRPLAGLRKAIELATGGGIEHPRVLWITDGMPAADAGALRALVRSNNLQVSVLGVGSTDGAPIPKSGGGFVRDAKGSIVVARLDPDALSSWANSVGGRYATAKVGDADIRYLLAPLKSRLGGGFKRHSTRFDQWRDSAAAFALALLPIALLAFRRGWILLLCVVVFPPHADAFSFSDLFQRPDQQGMHALDSGKPAEAAQHFRDPAWRGTALYRAGKYAEAARAFDSDHNANGRYNQGNALARAGKLEQALGAYRQALKLDPDDADAKYNKALVERLLEQRKRQQKPQKQQQNQQHKRGDKPSSPKSATGKSGDKGKSSSSNQGSQQHDDNDKKPGQSPSAGSDQGHGDEQHNAGRQSGRNAQPDNGQKSGDEQPRGQASRSPATGAQPKSPQQGKPDTAAEDGQGRQNDAETQVMNQWLRQIPDDPGELLRRKFEYEYRHQQPTGRSDRDDQRY